ncbi:unnamed protein product [Ectocarpus sp. 12 AP-2014]
MERWPSPSGIAERQNARKTHPIMPVRCCASTKMARFLMTIRSPVPTRHSRPFGRSVTATRKAQRLTLQPGCCGRLSMERAVAMRSTNLRLGLTMAGRPSPMASITPARPSALAQKQMAWNSRSIIGIHRSHLPEWRSSAGRSCSQAGKATCLWAHWRPKCKADG